MAGESNDKDWLELPLVVMANILSRIDVRDRLENAQKVCTTWRKIIKDPAMWRVIKIEYGRGPVGDSLLKMYMHAVDLSQGQLVDVNIIAFDTSKLLPYIADRATQLKRLHIACCVYGLYSSFPKTLEKFMLLEELSLFLPLSIETFEAAVCCCPMLKTLNVSQLQYPEDDWRPMDYDVMAKAVVEKLPYLRHLGLNYSNISNMGLQVILDGCCHLESLDLRRCYNINLKGDLGKRCSEQIKYLWLPNDPLEECEIIFEYEHELYEQYRADFAMIYL